MGQNMNKYQNVKDVTRNLNKFLKYILGAFVLFLAANLIAFPRECLAYGQSAVLLCLGVIIPSLFPFLVCGGLFIALGFARVCSRWLSWLMRPLFNLPGAGALAVVLGLVSGYPVGAKTAADLYASGECTKAEAERMLAFCNNSGPLFILGAVGAGMLQNPALGRMIYISHIISALLVGFIFRFVGNEKKAPGGGKPPPACGGSPLLKGVLKPAALPQTAGEAVVPAMYGAIKTMLLICGFVILFGVLGNLLPDFASLPLLRPVTVGLLEMTNGVSLLCAANAALQIKLPVISLLVSLS